MINVKVLPSYTSMLVNRGRYLVFFKRYDRAMAAFREALTARRRILADHTYAHRAAQFEAALHRVEGVVTA